MPRLLTMPALLLLISLASSRSSTAQVAPSSPAIEAEAPKDPAVSLTDDQSKSTAEMVVKLQRIIESNQKELDDLKAKLERPDNEYAKAEADFQEIDQQLNQKKESLKKAQDAGMADQAQAISKEINTLSQAWKLAKDRFDLSIRERKAINERVNILENSLVADRLDLKKLLGEEAKPEAPVTPEPPNPRPQPPPKPPPPPKPSPPLPLPPPQLPSPSQQ